MSNETLGQERNFCERCGKRVHLDLNDWDIHTCTPPEAEQDRFCDAHCTWLDHHPDCDKAEQEPYCYTYTVNGEEYFAPPNAYVPDDATPLYTRPQAREWVGLTQQDIDIAFDDTQEGGGFDDFARAIEAKLKEKNFSGAMLKARGQK